MPSMATKNNKGGKMVRKDLEKINKDMAKIETLIYTFASICIIVCIMLLNIGCTYQENVNRASYYSVEMDTQHYVNEFIAAAKKNNKDIVINDLVIQFQPDKFFKKPTEIGRCSRCKKSTDCTPEINIKQSWWLKQTTSDLNRREVIFHELGHCILYRDHKDTKDLAGYPISIMNAQQIGDNLYNETTISSYDTELFTFINPTAIGEENNGSK